MSKLTRGQRNELRRQDMFNRRKQLEVKGFRYFKNLHAGQNSNYCFEYKGRTCVFAFDSYDEITYWIEERLARNADVFRK